VENVEFNVIITKIHFAGIRNIVLNRLFVATTILVFFVSGCSRDIPADPMCRTDILYTETEPAAAACLIKSNVRLLAVKNHDTNGWNLPTHKQQNLISAQCTAHQAVWETTGLNVEVGKLLFTAPDETQYFECKLTDDFSRQLQEFPVPEWAQRKTSEISLVNPFSTEQDHWVNNINLITLREAYNQLE
jgi:adenine-specific DNA methylase